MTNAQTAQPSVTRFDAAGVATLTLSRGATFNALSIEMIAALQAHVAALAQDSAVRVVILAAEGKAFCAGHDLREMQAAQQNPDQGRAYFETLFANFAALCLALQALPQPVIAQVQGIATAAGCQLVAACDLVVASESAKFGVNGVNIGLFCSTPMVALCGKVPPAVAFELLSTGEFMTAARAREVGLVNRVCSGEDLRQGSLDLAQTIAGKLPSAVALGKAAFYQAQGLDPESAYALAGRAMVENSVHPDTAEGIAAFLQKRPPVWARG